jgi:nucleotide-binding universal stress UspA family protein
MITTTPFPTGSIVVGVDGSPSSILAVEWATKEAMLEHRPLALAHAYHVERVQWMGAMGIHPTELRTQLKAEGESLLDAEEARVREISPDVEIHQALYHADPRTALIEASAKASMVVVGSRGHGRVTSLLLGSVSAGVVRHASCPVVVRRPDEPSGDGILVGVTKDSQETLEVSWRLASELDVPVTMLLSEQLYSPFLSPDDNLALEHTELEHLSTVAARLHEKYPDVHAVQQVVTSMLAHALITGSRDHSMVVVGSHGGPMGHALAVAVVENASGTVVVVPDEPLS